MKRKKTIFDDAYEARRKNIEWFSRFTPLEKLRIAKRQAERIKKWRGLAERCLQK